MKLDGIAGTGSGKLGSTVFSVNAGTQIVRQYQPNVANPSTTAQVNQRAKLKLLSQMAASVANVLVIPAAGMVSARNGFISKNFPNVSAVSGVTSVDLPSLQITAGSVALPAVAVSRDSGTQLDCAFAESVPAQVNLIVYVAFIVAADRTLTFHDSAVINTPGAARAFAGQLTYTDNAVVVYAYGMIDNEGNSSAAYEDYQIDSGESIAQLVAIRSNALADTIFTKTVGDMLDANTTTRILSVTANGVSIPSSGVTQVQPNSSGELVITTEDADGLYLAVFGTSDNMLYDVINNNTASVLLNGARGGEVLTVAVGELHGSEFTPVRTYGGQIQVLFPNIQITSVTLNSTSIADSGSTQVPLAATMAFQITANNANLLFVRVYKGNEYITSGNIISGSFSANLNGLAVGDQLIVRVGNVINDVFVTAVQYGGTIVIAENPPSFTSVSVGGTSIAASGTTNVVAGNNLAITVNASNANGKYVLTRKNSGNWTSSGSPISSGVGNSQVTIAIGDQIEFAIGEYSPSGYIPDAIFGGKAVGIAQPSEGITAVSLNDTPMTGNVTTAFTSSPKITATAVGTLSSGDELCVDTVDVAVGHGLNNPTGNTSISSGSATINAGSFSRNGTFYIYVARDNEGTMYVKYKWPYTFIINEDAGQ